MGIGTVVVVDVDVVVVDRGSVVVAISVGTVVADEANVVKGANEAVDAPSLSPAHEDTRMARAMSQVSLRM
jgi:hypothetical protein